MKDPVTREFIGPLIVGRGSFLFTCRSFGSHDRAQYEVSSFFSALLTNRCGGHIGVPLVL